MTSENLDKGYYVVFSRVHTRDEELYTEENIEGKKIYTWIIRTNFEVPSKINLI